MINKGHVYQFNKAVRSFFSKQFLMFVLLSGFAALVNIVSRALFSMFIKYYTISIIFAYFFGMITAFILNKLITFRDGTQKNIHYEIGGFVLINILGLVQTLLISLIMVRYILPSFGIQEQKMLIGHICGVGAPIFTSFIGHKYITFGRFSIEKIGKILKRKDV